jgi:hypothetical protein
MIESACDCERHWPSQLSQRLGVARAVTPMATARGTRRAENFMMDELSERVSGQSERNNRADRLIC